MGSGAITSRVVLVPVATLSMAIGMSPTLVPVNNGDSTTTLVAGLKPLPKMEIEGAPVLALAAGMALATAVAKAVPVSTPVAMPPVESRAVAAVTATDRRAKDARRMVLQRGREWGEAVGCEQLHLGASQPT